MVDSVLAKDPLLPFCCVALGQHITSLDPWLCSSGLSQLSEAQGPIPLGLLQTSLA